MFFHQSALLLVIEKNRQSINTGAKKHRMLGGPWFVMGVETRRKTDGYALHNAVLDGLKGQCRLLRRGTRASSRTIGDPSNARRSGTNNSVPVRSVFEFAEQPMTKIDMVITIC